MELVLRKRVLELQASEKLRSWKKLLGYEGGK